MAQSYFTSTRGCVYVAGGVEAKGFYKFTPDIGASGRILIAGGDIDESDIIMPVVTLSQKKILYTFGPDWGKSTISGCVLLGEASEGGALLNTLIDWFHKNRAGKKTQPIQLAIPGKKSYNVFVTRLVIGSPDPTFNIQPFGIQLLIDS